jgi:hypothetical protein
MRRTLAPMTTLCLAALAAGCAGSQPAARRESSLQPARAVPSTHSVVGPQDPRELDLADLVPHAGRLDHVWYVPAGRGVPEVVVGWSYRGRHVPSTLSDTRYALTVWHPDHLTPGSARWNPQTLFAGSPFPFAGTSVRTADVTGDGHRDLLVTVLCNGCNHATASASVYADARGAIRRIYGEGFLDGSKGEHVGVHGRVISETAWGAWHGLVWFDEPRGGTAVCCPAFRLQTFLRQRHGRWHTVLKRKLAPRDDRFLGHRPVPAP